MQGYTHNDDATELTWRKSSYSGGAEGQCVEVAKAPSVIHIRDSKNQAGPTLTFTTCQFSAFTEFAASIT
ncbi:DUF397 domain-containing protein, partial [Streptomyces sp. NPDC057411]